MLNHAIETEWFHIRATKAYAEVEAKLYQDTPNPADWTEDQHKKLSRFLRYKTKHAHDVNAYLKATGSLSSATAAANLREQRANIVKHEKLESKQAKLESNQEKKQTEQDKSAKLAMLDALSQQGLVRWQDLEGVFD